MSQNPLLDTKAELPDFAAIKAEHVKPAVDELLASAREAFKQAKERLGAADRPTVSHLIDPIVEIEKSLERGFGPVGHLMGARTSNELRAAYEQVLPAIVNFGLELTQDPEFYQALKAFKDSDEFVDCTTAQRRTIEKQLLAAEQAGVGLSGQDKERFNAIERRLSGLSTKFGNNNLDQTKAFRWVLKQPEDVEGLPKSVLALMAQRYNEHVQSEANTEQPSAQQASAEHGPWLVTLDMPCVQPFLKEAKNRAHRETLYRAYVKSASEAPHDNQPLMQEILKLRQEKAALLGFDNYVDFSLASKMAGSRSDVEGLLEQLRKASYSKGKEEIAQIQNMAKEQAGIEKLELWDVAYWRTRLQEKSYSYDEEAFKAYFPFDRVLAGMFQLVDRIFGVRIEERPAGSVSVWDKDVRFFDIFDKKSGERIASFYQDSFSRPANKREGAWMDVCVNREKRADQDSATVPVAYLNCNFTPPVGDAPSLLNFREVETLFHEFGHGLQHMLTEVDDYSVSGLRNVEWDAVELPSQFMENWCYHRPTIDSLTAHVETGESLPDELFDKLIAMRSFFAGSDTLRQVYLSRTDLALHGDYDPNSQTESVFDVQHKVAETTSIIPPLAEDRFLCGFGHIFAGGYAAGYYSYKWAEVLSADAFGAFEDVGLDNTEQIEELGDKFRRTVLGLGGSVHPMEVYKSFRGREPNTEALLRHTGLA